MVGFIVMLVMAIVAVPLTLRHSAPFSLSAIPHNMSPEPIVIRPHLCVAGENGKELSSTILAKVCACILGLSLFFIFLMIVYGTMPGSSSVFSG